MWTPILAFSYTVILILLTHLVFVNNLSFAYYISDLYFTIINMQLLFYHLISSNSSSYQLIFFWPASVSPLMIPSKFSGDWLIDYFKWFFYCFLTALPAIFCWSLCHARNYWFYFSHSITPLPAYCSNFLIAQFRTLALFFKARDYAEFILSIIIFILLCF